MITFYFGLHTNERDGEGNPVHSYEEIFELNTSFKHGLTILRGIVATFIRIVGLKKEHELK